MLNGNPKLARQSNTTMIAAGTILEKRSLDGENTGPSLRPGIVGMHGVNGQSPWHVPYPPSFQTLRESQQLPRRGSNTRGNKPVLENTSPMRTEQQRHPTPPARVIKINEFVPPAREQINLLMIAELPQNPGKSISGLSPRTRLRGGV